MTPKEKANNLGNRFYTGSVFDHDKEGHQEEKKLAKRRAIICVEEIIACEPSKPREYNHTIGYWEEVIIQINKL